jgi:hypothetical protein
MQHWRYKVLVIRELALSESKLNAEGEKGWELVNVCMTDGNTARAFFKILDDGTLVDHHHPGSHQLEHPDQHNVADRALVASP